MKLLLALFVFILALGLSYTTIASDSNVCTPGPTVDCAAQPNSPTAENQHENKSVHATPHEGEHNELSKRMNSLFPEKHKNTSNVIRPATTQLVAPKFLSNVAGGTVKLQWSESANATSYHVQVATDPNFKWLISNEYSVKGTSYDVTNLEAGKRYFWRVASVKSENDSMYTKSLFTSSAFDTK